MNIEIREQPNRNVSIEAGDAFGLVHKFGSAWTYYVTGGNVADSPYYGSMYSERQAAIDACENDVRIAA